MADEAHELTDKVLKRLERNVKREYSTAVRDMSAKLQEYLEKDEIKRLEQEELLKAGKITKKEYQDWCFRHQMMGKRWEDMLNVLTEDMHRANEIALSLAKDKMPDIYALNMNYGTYEIEHGGRIDTGFTLYNHDTAEYLLGDQHQLMPKPSAAKAKQIAANKDMQWNKKKIQSAVLQGVLQGENPYKVAERLRSVGQMNYNSSVRYARTMGTSAQNAGRYESYRRAKRLGVDLTIEWSATLDGRTRHDHRLMHGQRTEVDEPFHTPDGFTIYYPADCTGDSDAPQQEIWNCRCTLLAWVKGFEGETVKNSPKMGGMSFDEWQQAKPIPNSATDNKQFQNYKNILGKQAPKTLVEFQNIKYNNPDEWKKLKADYHGKKYPQQPSQAKQPSAADTYKAKRDAAIANAKEFTPLEHEAANFSQAVWSNKLTDDERYAIERYTGSGYRRMNAGLRGVLNGVPYSPPADYLKCIKDAESGLKNFHLANDCILYRGLGDRSTFAAALGVSEQQLRDSVNNGSIVGTMFCEKGFVSTGVSKSAGWTKEVMMEIYAPKGTMGMYVDPISRNQGEHEALLQHHTYFEILDAKFNGYQLSLKVYVADQRPQEFNP